MNMLKEDYRHTNNAVDGPSMFPSSVEPLNETYFDGLTKQKQNLTISPAFVSGRNLFTTPALSPFPVSPTALPTLAPAPSARSLDKTGKRLYKLKKSPATAARTRGQFSAPPSFSVTMTQSAGSSKPAPSNSPLQSQRVKKSGKISKYVSREGPWLTYKQAFEDLFANPWANTTATTVYLSPLRRDVDAEVSPCRSLQEESRG